MEFLVGPSNVIQRFLFGFEISQSKRVQNTTLGGRISAWRVGLFDLPSPLVTAVTTPPSADNDDKVVKSVKETPTVGVSLTLLTTLSSLSADGMAINSI